MSFGTRTRFANDMLFALVSRLVPRIASTLLFVFLMRQSGVIVAGTYSLSVAFLTAGVLFTSLGLEELIVREVAQNLRSSGLYLINMLLLRAGAAIVGYAIIAGFVLLFPGYDPDVKRIVLIQGLGLLPEGLVATMFAVFNANRRLGWMAFLSICVSAFQLLAGGAAVWVGADLEIVVIALLAGSVLGSAVSAYLAFRLFREQRVARFDQSGAWRIDWGFCVQQLKLAPSFAALITLVSLDIQLDVLLLSAIRDVGQVGIYSAARTLILVLSLLPQAFRMTIYPSIARAAATSESDLRDIYRRSWHYLSLVGLPLVFGGMILSGQITGLVYGEPQIGVTLSFGILLLHLLAGFLYVPGTRLMIARDQQARLTFLLGGSILAQVLLSLVLVPQHGAVGAAISRAAASMIYFIGVELYVSRHILPGNSGWHMLIRPLLATAAMLACVWLLKSESLFLSVVIGALVYGAATVLMAVTNLRRWRRREQLP
jgi:O-antigen/teichoic acid export membrane protein